MKCRVTKKCFWDNRLRTPGDPKTGVVDYDGDLEELPSYFEPLEKIVPDEQVNAEEDAETDSGSEDDGDEAQATSADEVLEEVVAPAVVIRAFLEQVDHTDDANWTGGGLIRMDVVEDAVGEDVTRADVDAVWPDFKRNQPQD